MKALVQTGPEALVFRDTPDPDVPPDHHLVRIEHSGICGSDMHAFLGHDPRRPAPLILGHEAAGIVQGGPRDGERVTLNPLVACGVCPACRAGRDNLCPHRQIISMPPREGAFAQFVALPGANLIPLPDGLSTRKAALAEPIACGWHAVRLGLDLVGGADTALVIGGGAIGVGAALSLLAQGVPRVTLVEPNPLRRDHLAARASYEVLAPDAVETRSFDMVVDGVGIDATRATASARVRPGGAILHIGLGGGSGGLDIRRCTLQEIAFIGTYTYTAADFRATVAALADGRLGPLDWTETRALSDGARAFDDIRAGRVAAPKIILTP
ncbi:MAG: alcohol dehydrogenase catalytic domain-containing protein [Pseudomonadota bacterium]